MCLLLQLTSAAPRLQSRLLSVVLCLLSQRLPQLLCLLTRRLTGVVMLHCRGRSAVMRRQTQRTAIEALPCQQPAAGREGGAT